MTHESITEDDLAALIKALQKLPLPICAAIFADTWRSSGLPRTTR